MANAMDVAKLFLAWSNCEGDLISNLKMQKLLYYAQAWYVANTGNYLFDDDFEAWTYGPVIKHVYHEFKSFRSGPIQYKEGMQECSEEEVIFSQDELGFLKDYYAHFIEYSANRLVNASHNEKPWIETPEGEIIPKDKIRDYYSSLLA